MADTGTTAIRVTTGTTAIRVIAVATLITMLAVLRPWVGGSAPADAAQPGCPYTPAQWAAMVAANDQAIAANATALNASIRGGVNWGYPSYPSGTTAGRMMADIHQQGVFRSDPHNQPPTTGGKSYATLLAEREAQREYARRCFGPAQPPDGTDGTDGTDDPDDTDDPDAPEEPPEAPTGAARSSSSMGGGGATGSGDAWNCAGLEGTWQVRSELVIPTVNGVIAGETSFTMPPRPDEGPWQSEPTTLVMQGTIAPAGAVAETSWRFDDLVYTILTGGQGYELTSEVGSVSATMVVTTPDFTHTVETPIDGPPPTFGTAPITFEPHPACG